jgi:hypothetical protein
MIAFLFAVVPLPAHTIAEPPYRSCFEVAARLNNVPLDLLLAVAATESNFDPDARSDANAHGIMQIQWPGTARHLGVHRVAELYNPCLNISLGARYLRELLDRNDGDVERALASYNYGPTRIDAVADLPGGARAYAARVVQHRGTVQAGATAFRAAPAAEIRFDSASRARGYAATMRRLVTSARFEPVRTADGGHGVAMFPQPSGLSGADARTLQTLGWPEIAR